MRAPARAAACQVSGAAAGVEAVGVGDAVREADGVGAGLVALADGVVGTGELGDDGGGTVEAVVDIDAGGPEEHDVTTSAAARRTIVRT
jgi:hypothetical protein